MIPIYFYYFPHILVYLLPHILVYRVHDFELCCDHVSGQPDVYPHLSKTLTGNVNLN